MPRSKAWALPRSGAIGPGIPEASLSKMLASMDIITFEGFSYNDDELWKECTLRKGDRYWHVTVPGVWTIVYDEDEDDVGDALIDSFDDQCQDDYLEDEAYLLIDYHDICYECVRHIFLKRAQLREIRIEAIEDPYEYFHMGDTADQDDKREDGVRRWWKRWYANGMRRPS